MKGYTWNDEAMRKTIKMLVESFEATERWLAQRDAELRRQIRDAEKKNGGPLPITFRRITGIW